MTPYFCLVALLCVAVSAAPPDGHPRRQLYQQQAQAQLQNLSPLEFLMRNSEVETYYTQESHQRQDERGVSSRLETLEPDSEVELIPGAQQPQQPPQQTPVSPNLPGLVPGQRVFIVHMPVPGLRPGTIGGYQPLYIVAAAPQGQTAYAVNGIAPGMGRLGPGIPGYQNAVLLNQARLGAGLGVAPYFGLPAQSPAGLLVGGQLPYRGFEQVYQQVEPVYYQANPVPVPGPQQQEQQHQANQNQGAVQFSQLVSLHGQPVHFVKTTKNIAATQPESSKRVGETNESAESKEEQTEQRHNERPAPTHAQTRNKV